MYQHFTNKNFKQTCIYFSITCLKKRWLTNCLSLYKHKKKKNLQTDNSHNNQPAIPCPRPSLPANRPEAWCQRQTADVYCWRHVLLSETAQSWLVQKTWQRWHRLPQQHPLHLGCYEDKFNGKTVITSLTMIVFGDLSMCAIGLDVHKSYTLYHWHS